jgi:hypothetical protein
MMVAECHVVTSERFEEFRYLLESFKVVDCTQFLRKVGGSQVRLYSLRRSPFLCYCEDRLVPITRNTLWTFDNPHIRTIPFKKLDPNVCVGSRVTR